MERKERKAALAAEIEFATKIIERGEEMMPHWMIETKTGERLVLFTPFNESNKDDVVRLIRAVLIWKEATAYVFASEAWVTKHTPGNPWSGLLPSQSEAREEIVLIRIATKKDGDRNFSVPIIVAGEKRTLGLPEAFDKGTSQGRMIIPFPEDGETLPPRIIQGLERMLAGAFVSLN